jgi:hypothetical protein
LMIHRLGFCTVKAGVLSRLGHIPPNLVAGRCRRTLIPS